MPIRPVPVKQVPIKQNASEQSKVCTNCGQSWPDTWAYFETRTTCLACKNERLRDYRKAHPEKARAYYQTHKAAHRSRTLERRYGLSEVAYVALLVRQHDKCAICGQEETALDRSGNVKPLSVDHDHASGRIRGLLCHNCNVLVGQLESIQGEPATILASALHYLG